MFTKGIILYSSFFFSVFFRGNVLEWLTHTLLRVMTFRSTLCTYFPLRGNYNAEVDTIRLFNYSGWLLSRL
ncbi:hypothetical protein L211DRAFT_581949 [Terfezia boudieri ATCC MYA-4762]|uniref:Uncharacterized protein n=1 Tax=Terfezia boudieri ATCC MYA-4762 TaxID=1051890 RepID=A0A3N4LAC7_9PEZI|nr:hypothetical protein L211DRAFT_581949 [Terfezia boudieri ATCC MYA-4762]